MKIVDRKFLDPIRKSVHASTIAFHKGKPAISWFGGSREGSPDVRVFVEYDGEVAAFGVKNIYTAYDTCWNPILFPYKDKLFLFMKQGKFCDSWQTFIYDITYLSNSASYNPIQILSAGLNGPVKTCPVVITPSWNENDYIFCGSSVETFYNWTSYIETYFFDGLFRYDWRSNPISVPEGKGIIQPAIWHDQSTNRLNALFRSSSDLKNIYYAYSEKVSDYLDWSEPIQTSIPNPNSGVDVTFLNNKLYLAYNPSSFSRVPLIISELELNTNNNSFEIKDSITIEEKPINGVSMELSYPYLIDHDGYLHLTYTYARSKIEHVVISIDA